MNTLTAYYKNTGGGCFKRLVRLINATTAAGWTTHYISSAPFDLSSNSAIFHKAPAAHNNPYMIAAYYIFILPFRIALIAHKKKVDRFIAIGFPYAFTFILAHIALRIPIVILVRGDWMKELEASKRSRLTMKAAQLIRRLSALSASHIIPNSDSLKDHLIAVLPASCQPKLTVVYNDLPSITKPMLKTFREGKHDLRMKLGIPNDDFLVGYSGTLKSVKEVDILIEAFNQMSNPKSSLLIIGEGAEKDNLIKLAKRMPLSNRIHFVEWQEDPLPYVTALDLMVLPTKSEGCPNALLDALACEVPCIGSEVTGVVDVLSNPILLFQGNDLHELADKLTTIISSKTHYQSIITASQQCAEKFIFDWNNEILSQIQNRH